MTTPGESALRILSASWQLWIDMSLWLTAGLLIAGLLKVFFPVSLVHRWLGQPGLLASIKAAVIGTPLPLCSCSVLPAAMQLHRSGASSSATVSFLVATPENGADSILMSWGLLGPAMTIARVISALLSATVAGLVTGLLDRPSTKAAAANPVSLKPNASSAPPEPAQLNLLPVIQPSEMPGLKHGDSTGGTDAGIGWMEGLRYAFTRLLQDIAHWVVIGIVTAAVIQELVPPNAMVQWGNGPWVMLAVLAVSIPTYVCATASTPIAASLLAAGMSPGAVLVFLLAGPASNFSSAAIVRKELGNRALIGYLTGVVGMTLVAGFCVDWLFPAFSISPHQHMDHSHSLIPQWAAQMIGIAMAVRVLWLWQKTGVSRLMATRSRSKAS